MAVSGGGGGILKRSISVQLQPSALDGVFQTVVALLLGFYCASATWAQDRILIVTDPTVLSQWERHGLSFETLTGDKASIAPIHQKIKAEISSIQRSDPLAGVGIARYPHRLFDVRWLDSSSHRFELVGVVNRSDRYPFYSPQESCGETRLIYRLAYEQSRLPMTISLEFKADGAPNLAACSQVWDQWKKPHAVLDAEDGPLHPSRLVRERLAQLAVNLQSMRWPSTVHPQLGGHAEYLLMAFNWHATKRRFVPRPLENTPDVARLIQQPERRNKLLGWLLQPNNLDRLDKGTLKIPAEFLAFTAISVAPAGMARRANRPFSQIFKASDFQYVPGEWRSRLTLRSPQAFLRRLDDLSCMGCHQSRSTAGFHFLGAEHKGVPVGNALALPASVHLEKELLRRRDVFATRMFAESGEENGGFGQACGLGDPGFSHWTCSESFQCTRHGAKNDPTVGVCMPKTPEVGGLCEPAQIASHAHQSTKDHASLEKRLGSCVGAGGVCEATAVGFPGGMCSGDCNPLMKNSRCGAIAVLSPFNACLGKNRPFAECLKLNSRPANLRACGPGLHCRDDYICAQSEAGVNNGVCIPPYFLFQLRVDGHP